MTRDTISSWPASLPLPIEYGKARKLICLSPDMLPDTSSLEALVHDLFWFPDDYYYIFAEASTGIGAKLAKDLKEVGISVELTQRCFYPHPNPGFKNDFVHLTPDKVEYDWHREATQKTEHIRLTVALAPWKRKDLDLSYAAEASAKRSDRRLARSVNLSTMEAVSVVSVDLNLRAVGHSIREALERGEPEEALDRLHTLFTAYLRALCENRSGQVDRKTPLHSLMGSYLKGRREGGGSTSEMTERILKSTISLLEAFNTIRNDHSPAHDNKILSHDESLLIANSAMNSIRFIHSIESTDGNAQAP